MTTYPWIVHAQTTQLENIAVTATNYKNSYTTGASDAAIGLNLSLKETPQSVFVTTQQKIKDQKLDNIITPPTL